MAEGNCCGSDGKESACKAGVVGSIPGQERSPGEGNGNPLQYSCLENPMDRGAWVGYSPRGRKESDTTEWLHFISLPASQADSSPSKQPGKPCLYLYKWYLSVLVLCLVIFLCFCIRLFKNYHIETFCKYPVLWGIIFKLFCCSSPTGTGLCCIPFI